MPRAEAAAVARAAETGSGVEVGGDVLVLGKARAEALGWE